MRALGKRLFLPLFTVAALGLTAQAGEECCALCGRAAACGKVCRVVAEEKQVQVTCWGSKSEYFCVRGPSKQGREHCESVCETCDTTKDGTGPHAPAKRFLWKEWMPGCAEVHTRKKLMKKTVTVTVPSHKWVVEDLCPECQARTGAEPVAK